MIRQLKENKNVCCICGKEIKGYGNNAAPVKSGTCCDECNTKVVIPARLGIKEELKEDYNTIDLFKIKSEYTDELVKELEDGGYGAELFDGATAAYDMDDVATTMIVKGDKVLYPYIYGSGRYRRCIIFDSLKEYLTEMDMLDDYGDVLSHIAKVTGLSKKVIQGTKDMLGEGINDGWELEDNYDTDLLDILDDCQRLAYEVKNTIRGAYTKCTTYKELAEYISNLADQLKSCASDLVYMNEPEDIEEACETNENISETKEIEEVTEELTTECNSRETNDSQKNLMDRLQEAIDTFNDCIVEAEVNNDPDSAQQARELADKVEEARENFKKLTGEK